MTEQWVFVAVNVGLVIAMGFLLTLHKRTLGSIDARADRHEERIAKLETGTVNKEDWLRETALNRQRLETILARINQIDGHNQAATQIASAISAAFMRESQTP